ncbi:LysR substrate-binding domain-containing protein [Phreatobacter sp. AB_2022a]|uniref:LysR substrate-binding domain-containing protein n=1 Tax=Phreatobacter sp. AB_2022a TaxID=3003134 RepID=UPI0022874F09|nr:LysR substrate-binding domain-containing protein [Phreatobacter sp. AB_2022a]MCZ0733374.1 LysR substrate-binding domain-containing protein [Phreatobacter sp. AB_2022a]
MLNLTALRSFHQAASSGGIAAAARQLNVTPGAIRYQIRQLEQELGERLVVRSKRVLQLTKEGSLLHDRLSHAFHDIRNACRSVAAAEQMEGELYVACAPALAASRLNGIVRAYCRKYPRMTVRLFPIDAANETMDVVISYGERAIPGARVAILGAETYFAVCAPELKYELSIEGVDDLERCVGLHADAGGDWMRVLSAAAPRDIQFAQQIYFPNAAASLMAARDGCGVAVGTSILCAEDLRRGTLVRLFDVSVPAPNPYFVICPGPSARASAESFVEMFVAQIGAA